MASSLPHDVLLAINRHLGPEDRYACLFVCRQWYIAFAMPFYESVLLKDDIACEQLCQTLEEDWQQSQRTHHHADLPNRTLRPLMDAISQIKLHMTDTDHLLITELRRIASYCRSLKSLEVYILWDMPPELIKKALQDQKTLAASVQHGFFCHLPPQLTRLELRVPMMESTMVHDLLHHMPNLTHFDINWIAGVWSMPDMDRLHRACPRLVDLRITADAYAPSPSPSPSQEGEPLVIQACLRNLYVATYRGMSDLFADWLQYATQTYHATLETLTLEARPQGYYYRSSNRPFEIDLLTTALEYSRGRVRHHRGLEDEISVFRTFRRSCRRLVSLDLMHIHLTTSLLRENIIQTGLSHMGMTKNFGISDEALPEHRHLPDTLTSLNLQAIVAPLYLQEMLRGLPLSNLSLTYGPKFALHSLFATCPQLTSLTLERAQEILWKPQQYHPRLTRLNLINCALSESLLDRISEGLPQLSHLTMDSCKVYCDTQKRSCWTRLNLTGIMRLDTIEIRQLLLMDAKHQRQVALVGVDNYDQTNEGVKWYHVVCPAAAVYPRRPRERVLGQRPLVREAHDEIVSWVIRGGDDPSPPAMATLAYANQQHFVQPWGLLLITCRRGCTAIPRVNGMRLLRR
ncbi:hypothetical protein BCR43DRAFT_492690 [Syncephalastrum racemosum]|uniref:F-box domain-containing protein n=1 Tax=Syncephalastrum racemosum TaxID=13706 RepID=A0A1X2H9B4_SYNRA|nr:hypothetical protein BCR43DRAFT_492690 [Syncephalastrum racemosum]